MTDIQTRPFSKNYSGLINQTVIAAGLTILCVGGQELMKRARRGKGKKQTGDGLGSRESWEFGYLFQGRSWAWKPSPPTPGGWMLSWVPQVVSFPEEKMNSLRGVDATLYIRFLRGCFYFTLLHTLTTFPILFPIHVHFSDSSIDQKSMTRASISSLVTTEQGKSLLWIHISILFWITFTWIATLFWVSHGAFLLRSARIKEAGQRTLEAEYHPHPHPQYAFTSQPTIEDLQPCPGLRLRTIMVSNVSPQLRSEKTLKEYFEYFMSRKLERPAIGLTSNTQPGFINKSVAYLFNRAKRIPVIHPEEPSTASTDVPDPDAVPDIERVVIARKMTELASLLERREDILRLLETAHIKLANTALIAVQKAMERKDAHKPFSRQNAKVAKIVAQQRKPAIDPEEGVQQEGTLSEDERMEVLIKALGPFVDEFELRPPPKKHNIIHSSKHAFQKLRTEGSSDSDDVTTSPSYPPASKERRTRHKKTIWDALISVPRSSLDAYQPLISLSHLFRGKTVPSIDYYTAKLNLLTSLITENRARHVSEYDPVSTAFVTFADPADARRACKYLAVHPHNPLTCMVSMAPEYQDLDWVRVMKSSFDAEFVKDWVVSLGVWAFTVFWLFPVSLLVGLVSIQNISAFWPGLKAYLDKHKWEEEVIQSFLPTLLVALLALLIPLILLLIAKKAHTITTLSALHDRIMTRYYKFLIVNVLVFFCVGTVALQSILDSFRANTSTDNILQIVASSFPSAGPFYVGWQIFTTAMHGGFEIALLGLPLIMYPATRGQVTPRKRTVGTRPRTFNYYYWLPTHILLVHVLVVFAVLNPFVLPFGTLYFFVESGIIKNQLLHIYAKNYEGDGKLILIRVIRYSLDGLILSQSVFLAYMVVLKRTGNIAAAAVLIVFTAVFKVMMTRMCRTQFELDDINEANTVFASSIPTEDVIPDTERDESIILSTEQDIHGLIAPNGKSSKFNFRVPEWVTFSYRTIRHHNNNPMARQPNPFRPAPTSFSRIGSRSTENSPTTPSRMTKEGYLDGTVPISPSSPDVEPKIHNEDDFTAPVVPHPPPVAWDDLTTPDLPYDNPYYVRPISTVLWLPRNPCGVLDLDDTVDMKTSLTVEHTSGKLGTWVGISETESPIGMSQISLDPSNMHSTPSIMPSAVSMDLSLDGTQDIDLPLIIAKRVEAGEADIEQVRPRRPSTYRHRPSTGSSSRRQNSLSRPLIKSYRSFSEGTAPSSTRRRSNSIMTTLELPPPVSSIRSSSPGRSTHFGSPRPESPYPGSSPQPGSISRSNISRNPPRPDTHAQAEFVTESASKLSLNIPPLRRAENISAHHAILREVMAEEEEAFVDRLESEEAQANTTRSFLTSWMFKKVPNTDLPGTSSSHQSQKESRP